MFRRRSSSKKYAYLIHINKEMCPNSVNVIADDIMVLNNVSGSDYEISVSKPITYIYIQGSIVWKPDVITPLEFISAHGIISGSISLDYNTGSNCSTLATHVVYGHMRRSFTPVTSRRNPSSDIYFNYDIMESLDNTETYRLAWKGTHIANQVCILTDWIGTDIAYAQDSHAQYSVNITVSA